MPFRDSDKEYALRIAHFAKVLLTDYEASHASFRRFQYSILKMMCRWLEMFNDPKISVKAAEKAGQLGIGIETLRRATWKNQIIALKDPKREIFHFEHVTPVRELAGKVLELRNSSVQEIAQLLLTAEIAWILKDEDDRLTKLGYRSKRPDPQSAYEQAGIRFVDS